MAPVLGRTYPGLTLPVLRTMSPREIDRYLEDWAQVQAARSASRG